ncbi:MAG: DNA polymerase III subunit gamma/tau [Geminicoccaceae bacterium]
MTESPPPYRVLARAYRPQRLSELVGQNACVRTLTNAFKSGRIAHAFLLTGIRGVGKTTTARIIARALNCVGPDGQGGPTPEPCGFCEPCVAIAEDRHIDVIEMDAATRTGIDDVRELVESVRYAPGSGRYKIYIIDEIHMLSEKAFNALLKTLEEPPPHVKFVFATTEIRKLPVTVLSRCQRFDLRRVDLADLTRHFAAIAEDQGIEISTGALELIARAADGSVRDGLSLLDQAMTLAEGRIERKTVVDMMGLADRDDSVTLLAALADGEIKIALDRLAGAYAQGQDPSLVVQDLLALVHELTQAHVGERAETRDPDLRDLMQKLGLAELSRAWQMLLKGLEEVRTAPDPLAAAEMLLVRLGSAAKLPPPDALMRLIRDQEMTTASATLSRETEPAAPIPVARSEVPLETATIEATGQGGADERPAELPSMPQNLDEVVTLLRRSREPMLGAYVRESARVFRFEPGRIELRWNPGVPNDIDRRLQQVLGQETGRRWVVVAAEGPGGPETLAERDRKRQHERLKKLQDHPEVKAVLEKFPGATILGFATEPEDQPVAPPSATGSTDR